MKGGYPLRIDFHTHVFPDKLAEKHLLPYQNIQALPTLPMEL